MGTLRRLGRCLVTVALGAVAGLAVPGPARAAGLEQVPSFGTNPGNLSMYLYRPDALPAGAAVVVLLHGCTQNAAGYLANSGWRKFADQWRFALVLPEQQTANNAGSCFTWFQPGDTARDQGEALSVRQMVGRAVTGYGLDPARVFVSGLSAGGAMSAVMLATYPDVFAAGSVVAGLPYRCATSLSQASTCQYAPPDRTPAQWGDLVRAAYPGYAGPRPRVAVWHGRSDYTVVPANGAELRDQFTDVLGVPAQPASTSSQPAGTTLEVYGADQVRLYRVAGMGHGTPVDPGTAADQCGTTAAYFLDTICSAYPRCGVLRPRRRRRRRWRRARRARTAGAGLPDRDQLRARAGRSRLRQRRIRACAWIGPADGPLHRLRLHHPVRDGPGLLGDRLIRSRPAGARPWRRYVRDDHYRPAIAAPGGPSAPGP